MCFPVLLEILSENPSGFIWKKLVHILQSFLTISRDGHFFFFNYHWPLGTRLKTQMWVLPLCCLPSSDSCLSWQSPSPHLYRAVNHVLTWKHLLTCSAGYSVIFKLEEIQRQHSSRGPKLGFEDTHIKYNALGITKAP